MSFQEPLLQWFAKNQRPLPWRKHYSPYDVWISEIMLQQTQMDTVLPYFERWMKTFPTVQVLAQSDLKKVLKSWEGLGYYSRARNLHESAQRIVKEHGGEVPSDFEAIRSLKGVGRYTAGAISSIAFNQPKPIVDGNVFRVLSRIYAISAPIDVPKNQEAFWELQESLIPKGHAREFNQGLMELGALICAPANPLCALCPVQKHCKSYKNGDPENYPVKIKKTKSVKIVASAVVVEKAGKYLLHFRPAGEIMGGLWEFPEWKLAKNTVLSLKNIEKKTAKLLEKDLCMSGKNLEYLDIIKRNYTYFNEALHVFRVGLSENDFAVATGDARRGAPSRPEANASEAEDGMGLPRGRTRSPKDQKIWETVWISKKDFSKYPFSSAHAKIAKLLTEK